MRKAPIFTIHFLLILLLTFFSSSAIASSPPDFVSLARDLKPAVVNISTSKTVKKRPSWPGQRSPYNDFFDEFFDRFFQDRQGFPRQERSLGSGFIIDEDGYILTNNHVVSDADEIKVLLADGRIFEAKVKGLDPKLDLALLKINTDGEELPVASLGDSEELEVGEWVMAIGNPFGLEQTVTVGIVSAKGRVIGAGPYDDFIQTDASINPGNSGGPLFNTKGKVVGINTAIIAGGQGIGFATPINAAKSIIPQLKETGHVTRGWLGVSIQQINEELAESFGLGKPKGALVSEVTKDSPADKAGVKTGDIILSFDGKEIEDMKDLPRLVAAKPVNDLARMKVFRKGKTLELSVKIGKLEEEGEKRVASTESAEKIGITVTDLTPEKARLYRLEEESGVLITTITPSGPAAKANLRPGDLILEVDDQKVDTAKKFHAVVAKAKEESVLRLLIKRQDRALYVAVKID